MYEVEPRLVTAIFRGAGLSSLTARLSRYNLVVTMVLKVAGHLRVGLILNHQDTPKKCKLPVFFKNDMKENSIRLPHLPPILKNAEIIDYEHKIKCNRKLESKNIPDRSRVYCGVTEIRTRDTLLAYTRFPGVPLQPLEHHSNLFLALSSVGGEAMECLPPFEGLLRLQS